MGGGWDPRVGRGGGGCGLDSVLSNVLYSDPGWHAAGRHGRSQPSSFSSVNNAYINGTGNCTSRKETYNQGNQDMVETLAVAHRNELGRYHVTRRILH